MFNSAERSEIIDRYGLATSAQTYKSEKDVVLLILIWLIVIIGTIRWRITLEYLEETVKEQAQPRWEINR